MHRDEVGKDDVDLWYEEKINTEELPRETKNIFFDVQTHFPKETSRPDLLSKAAVRVAALPTTVSLHEIRQKSVQSQIEKIRKRNENEKKMRESEKKERRVPRWEYKH
jgi:hypothetical protein